MTDFRAHWSEDPAPVTPVAPALRVVSRSAPSRPRWSKLYAALIVVSLLGAVGHFGLRQSVVAGILDGAYALAVVAVLARWVFVNRIALARCGEPESGTGMPRVRVIRSRRSDAERIVFPYDVR
jgi:hypothetical protein